MVYRMCFDEEAYLAGYIAADGHINKKDYTISIYTGKYESALMLKGMLAKYTGRKVGIRQHKRVYEVYVTDKALAIYFHYKYKIPIGYKADKVKLSNHLNECSKRSFIAGFFDGDGSIYMRKYRRKNGMISTYLEIKIKSKSFKLLSQIKIFLSSLGIHSRIKSYPRHVSYLVISKSLDSHLFFKCIPTILKRP